MQARTALCVDCTNGGFAFLDSPFPQLLAHMKFELLYRSRDSREYTGFSIADTILRLCRRNNLQARTAWYVHCTNGGFAFLTSPFPQFLAHM